MTHETRMTRARSRLLMEQPWFGSLAMRLKIEPDATIKTLRTDGSTLKYNPAYVEKLPEPQLIGCVAHEVMHCALLHPYRRGGKDLQRWNAACDYAINPLLVKAGIALPKGNLDDPKYYGLAADVIYAQLGQEPGGGQPGTDESPTGSFTDAPSDADGPGQPGKPGDAPGKPGAAGKPKPGMTAEDWNVAAEQATMVTKAAGNLPGDASRAAKAAQANPEDWRAILREFIEQTAPSDYSWSVPNRRHAYAGLYLPGVVKENLGRIAVVVDTSGSISQPILDLVGAELTAIVHEANPEAVDVIYCDSKVRHTETFTPDDAEIIMQAKGGGGTRFAPAFEHIAEKFTDPPVCCLYFTDMENYDRKPLKEPPYPVLWVTGKHVIKTQPFGRVIRVEML